MIISFFGENSIRGNKKKRLEFLGMEKLGKNYENKKLQIEKRQSVREREKE